MKLSDFSVVNYRSITTARKIKTNNMTVLVGKNNEGKSNILRALTLAMDIMKIYSKDPRSLQIAVRPYLKNHYSWEKDYPISLQEKNPNGWSSIDLNFELDEQDILAIRSMTGIRLSGCIPVRVSTNGAAAKIDIPKRGTAAFADAEDSASDETLSSDGSMTHPVHDYCQEELDSVELDFRIEPPSKSILDNFDHYTAAVVIVDRWYKHEGHTIAYSLSFIPIELVGRLQIDLNSTDALLEFLEHTCYEQGHHCSRCVTYSTAGNFSAKNYKLSSHDSFLMTQENVYDENEEILVVSKHYIPAEVFELKFSI